MKGKKRQLPVDKLFNVMQKFLKTVGYYAIVAGMVRIEQLDPLLFPRDYQLVIPFRGGKIENKSSTK